MWKANECMHADWGIMSLRDSRRVTPSFGRRQHPLANVCSKINRWWTWSVK